MDYSFADILRLLGSLGLFLYGMKVMSDALQSVAGDKMRKILASLTSNRLLGVFTGFLITTIIQSSSATTLMVVSFVNASLLTLTESIAVIMGANIGTTITAWLITILGFKVSMSSIALPLVGLGFLMVVSKHDKVKKWGNFVVGFSILFIGLQFLKDAVPDIGENPAALQWLQSYTTLGFWSIIIFLLIGTILTVVLQSSSATMALTLVMCFQGWIPFEMAAAMVLGENIGTTITANIAAIVANYNAKRTARAHFIFNIIGVIWMLILFYPFIKGIDWLVQYLGSSSPFVNAASVPTALSLFHTSFNIINTSLLILLITPIVKVVKKLVPYKAPIEPAADKPKFLNKTALQYPQTAIKALVDEARRLLEGPTFKVVSHALNLHRTDIKSDVKLKEIIQTSKEEIEINIDEVYYSQVKTIYGKIVKYAAILHEKFNLSPEKSEAINNIRISTRLMVEIIKDCKGLKNNVSRHMNSDNEYVKKEYNLLRKKISRVLRSIYLTGQDLRPINHIHELEKLKEKAKKIDILQEGTLDHLIRNKLISSEMAASLANDSDNVAGIAEKLIKIAEFLYIQIDVLADNPVNEKVA